ncbi:MAG: 1-acyl-sn-glycerol-3-phosphate acyltransferase [Firmicutes bacterium]|nr:1-acyl-sn-glycerol-3-phosphate acyltransferase [Bacillota bacterium]
MLFTILWLILTAVILIISTPWVLYAKNHRDKSPAGGPHPLIVKVIHIVIPLIGALAGAKVVVRGKENIPQETACFTGNHQSYLDALVILLHLGDVKAYLLKKELMSVPLLNWYIEATNSVPLDRENVRKSVESIRDLTEKLKNGVSVALFPEGTRSHGPQMGEFKPGAFKAAQKARVPIVPFAIDGSYKLFEEKGHIRPGTFQVSVLAPIPPAEYDGLTTQEISDLVKSRIQAELEQMRK